MMTATAAAGLTVGVRVVRGPDWKWANQDDGEGKTTRVAQVVSLCLDVI